MLPSNQEGTILVHRTSGRLPVATIAPNKSDPRQPAVLKIVSKTSVPWRQQSHPPPQQPMTTEKSNKVEPLVVDGEELPKEEVTKASVSANHKALQKLTAAVRSMEELYSFSKNEWKRKSDPLPITDSHVLSLITREEQTIGAINTAREESMMVAKTEDQEATQTVGLTTSPSRSAPERQPRGRFTNPTKNTEKVSAKTAAFENLTRERARVSGFHGESASRNTGSAEKESVPVVPRTTVTFNAQGQKAKHQPPVLSSPSPPRGLKGQARPRAMKLFGNRQGSLVEPDKSRKPTFPDCGNYLAISLKESSAEQPAPVALGTGEGAGGGSRAGPVATASPAATQPLNLGRSVASFNPIQAPQQQQQQPTATTTQPLAQRQPPLPPQPQLQAAAAPPLEMSPAHIFPQALSLAAAAAALTGAAQPATPLLCFSPPTSAEPAAFPPQTQRKVLLDLSTGQCYFVDTPLQPQPQKRRLFDPETGQYVEVPLLAPPPQPPALAPMTIPMSSLALGAAAGTYSAPAAAYMFYPGFLPAVLSATALQGQLAQQPSGELGSAAASSRSAASPATESPYYMPTGTQQQQQPCPQAASSDGKAPLISITSQPLGPRIIAPPSFDGTTMRFVVEHR
ncbi:hypothetical protein NXF25_013709 [Crotalus adamanteus]|uniref:DUF4585 domain-containing protein n=1 Tax=Crotalus adamanteus TaxID=8729 RepID=A0AAW1B9L9_CROAD